MGRPWVRPVEVHASRSTGALPSVCKLHVCAAVIGSLFSDGVTQQRSNMLRPLPASMATAVISKAGRLRPGLTRLVRDSGQNCPGCMDSLFARFRTYLEFHQQCPSSLLGVAAYVPLGLVSTCRPVTSPHVRSFFSRPFAGSESSTVDCSLRVKKLLSKVFSRASVESLA